MGEPYSGEFTSPRPAGREVIEGCNAIHRAEGETRGLSTGRSLPRPLQFEWSVPQLIDPTEGRFYVERRSPKPAVEKSAASIR
jgi:hypothetical protein